MAQRLDWDKNTRARQGYEVAREKLSGRDKGWHRNHRKSLVRDLYDDKGFLVVGAVWKKIDGFHASINRHFIAKVFQTEDQACKVVDKIARLNHARRQKQRSFQQFWEQLKKQIA